MLKTKETLNSEDENTVNKNRHNVHIKISKIPDDDSLTRVERRRIMLESVQKLLFIHAHPHTPVSLDFFLFKQLKK